MEESKASDIHEVVRFYFNTDDVRYFASEYELIQEIEVRKRTLETTD